MLLEPDAVYERPFIFLLVMIFDLALMAACLVPFDEGILPGLKSETCTFLEVSKETIFSSDLPVLICFWEKLDMPTLERGLEPLTSLSVFYFLS